MLPAALSLIVVVEPLYVLHKHSQKKQTVDEAGIGQSCPPAGVDTQTTIQEV